LLLTFAVLVALTNCAVYRAKRDTAEHEAAIEAMIIPDMSYANEEAYAEEGVAEEYGEYEVVEELIVPVESALEAGVTEDEVLGENYNAGDITSLCKPELGVYFTPEDGETITFYESANYEDCGGRCEENAAFGGGCMFWTWEFDGMTSNCKLYGSDVEKRFRIGNKLTISGSKMFHCMIEVIGCIEIPNPSSIAAEYGAGSDLMEGGVEYYDEAIVEDMIIPDEAHNAGIYEGEVVEEVIVPEQAGNVGIYEESYGEHETEDEEMNDAELELAIEDLIIPDYAYQN